jgi:uncharacterized protein YndB with AHSA1/START domain
MRRAIYVLAVLVAIILVVTVIGYSLPEDHTATAQRTYDHSVAAVWSMITTVERYPEWRPSVEAVEVLSASGERPKWRETWSRREKVTFRVTEWAEPRQLAVVIDDDDLPYGGRWVYGLSHAGDGCTLTITEEGEVHNPIFRFVARLFMDPTKTIDVYLDNLEQGLSSNPGSRT